MPQVDAPQRQAQRTWDGVARCYSRTGPLRTQPTRRRRYIFCATFLQVALTGRYPAHCPAEFGLSSRLRDTCVPLGPAIVWLAANYLLYPVARLGGGRSPRRRGRSDRSAPRGCTRPIATPAATEVCGP